MRYPDFNAFQKENPIAAEQLLTNIAKTPAYIGRYTPANLIYEKLDNELLRVHSFDFEFDLEKERCGWIATWEDGKWARGNLWRDDTTRTITRINREAKIHISKQIKYISNHKNNSYIDTYEISIISSGVRTTYNMFGKRRALREVKRTHFPKNAKVKITYIGKWQSFGPWTKILF